jgi:hypothetical protein
MAYDPRQPVASPGDAGDARELFSADGVDLTLIRWMLSLTPWQRLQVLQDHVNTVMRLRRGPTGVS